MIIEHLKGVGSSAYKHILSACRTSYIKYEEIKGTYILEKESDNDIYIVGMLFNKANKLKRGSSISLKTFYNRLKKMFPEDDLSEKELVEQYFSEKIVSNKEMKRIKENSFSKHLNDIKTTYEVDGEYAEEFVVSAKVTEHKLYAHLKKTHENDPRNVASEWKKIDRMIKTVRGHLKGKREPIKLPILASISLGDPHGFDVGSVYRGLFFYILSKETGKQIDSRSTEEALDYLSEFDIYLDYVSSYATVYGLTDNTKSRTSLWPNFYEVNQPLNVSLANVLDVDSVSAPPIVIAVENPAVFEKIISRIPDSKIGIICTYGNMMTAAVKLLSKIDEKKTTVFYSGDIDYGGVIIANRLKKRFPGLIDLSLYNESIYLNNKSNVFVSQGNIERLASRKTEFPSELKTVVELIEEYGKAVYQESFFEDILSFTILKSKKYDMQQ